MGTLTSLSDPDDAPLPLRPLHLVGRLEGCDLRLQDGRVSSRHAELRWDGAAWSLRDLGSRNGSAVDGQRLQPGHWTPLAEGAELLFGSEAQRWRLSSAAPPRPWAEPLDGGPARLAEGELLALGGEDDAPALSVQRDGRGRWSAESDDSVWEVVDGEVLQLEGRAWRLRLPAPVAGTLEEQGEAMPQEDPFTLDFEVSLDEEHVRLTVSQGGRVVSLRPRAHNYLLLTLARRRLEDAQDPGLPASAQGWVDHEQLARDLRLGERQVNLQVFRARKQLAEAEVERAAEIVERRVDARQLRIGSGGLSVRQV